MRVKASDFPIAPLKSIRALSEANLARVQEATRTMEDWGGGHREVHGVDLSLLWVKAVITSTCSLGGYRCEGVNDILSAPQGEDAGYGIPQWIPILPYARPYVLEYLEARKVYLESNGFSVDSWPLIPSIYRGEVKEHSSNNFRDIKEKIEEVAQMDFKLKDFRATCAQMIKDRNKGPVELATKQLRHSGPDTTYRSYAQIRSDTANEEVNNLFPAAEIASISNDSNLNKQPDGIKFLIPEKNKCTG
jgi:hypothetical protein